MNTYVYQNGNTRVLRYTPVPPQPAGGLCVPLHGRCFPPACAVQSCVDRHCCGPVPAAGLGTDTSPPAPLHESAGQSGPTAPLATVLSVCMGRTHHESSTRNTLYGCFDCLWTTPSNCVMPFIVSCVLLPAVNC